MFNVTSVFYQKNIFCINKHPSKKGENTKTTWVYNRSHYSCDFARKVWQQFDLSPTVDIASQTGLKTALVASRTTRCLPPLGVTTNILPWIFWAMWTARNTLIFEKKTFTVEDTAIKGIRLAREWIQAQPASHASPVRAMRGSTSRLVLEATHRSSTDITNCKTDAAWDKKTNTAGIAWIIEDPPPIHRLAGSDDTSNHLLSSCGWSSSGERSSPDGVLLERDTPSDVLRQPNPDQGHHRQAFRERDLWHLFSVCRSRLFLSSKGWEWTGWCFSQIHSQKPKPCNGPAYGLNSYFLFSNAIFVDKKKTIICPALFVNSKIT